MKKKIFKEMRAENIFNTINQIPKSYKNGLVIKVQSRRRNVGRGYGGFASATITFGAAPTKLPIEFNVQYENYKNGKIVKSFEENFVLERNASVLSDTQKYKEKAAKRIAGKAKKLLVNLK